MLNLPLDLCLGLKSRRSRTRINWPANSTMAAATGLFAKLSEVQEQQRASSANLELLRDQHREWQRSVEELLAGIRTEALPVPVPLAPLAPLAPAETAVTTVSHVTHVSLPKAAQAEEKDTKDTNSTPSEENNANNAHVAPDDPNRATFSRRSMSTESLLRSGRGPTPINK